MVGQVDYYCDEPGHQTWTPGDTLTMHVDRWAYCPTGQDAGHDWQPTGGMPLVALKRRLGSAAA